MKKLLWVIFVCSSQVAAAPQSEIPKKAKETVRAAGELVGTTRSELTASFQENLAKLDNDLRDLRAKIEKSGKRADVELQRQLAEVEAQRNKLKQRFEDLESSSQSALSDVENGLRKAWSDLSDSLRSAKGRFEKTK